MHVTGGAHPRYLQKIVGFAETDLGMGLVVEAVRSRDGSFAPTVATLASKGLMDGAKMKALDHFLEQVVASPAIVSDLNPFNVVYGDADPEDDHFVLIDGIGHKNLIPLERISATINRWSKERKVARFRVMLAERMAAPGNPADALQGGTRQAR